MDQFYTKPSIAEYCITILQNIIDIHSFNIQLEPSAGNGSFLKRLDEDKRIGIDINTKDDECIQQDFMTYSHQYSIDDVLIISNPPFGRNGSKAIQFFNKSAQLSSCIAFIVPRTFKRVSVNNQLNRQFYCIYTEDLPLNPCCFEPKMNAKCCFQVWVKKDEYRPLVIYPKSHPHFTFLRHGPKDERNQPTVPKGADFALRAYGSNCGEIRTTELETLRPKS